MVDWRAYQKSRGDKPTWIPLASLNFVGQHPAVILRFKAWGSTVQSENNGQCS